MRGCPVGVHVGGVWPWVGGPLCPVLGGERVGCVGARGPCCSCGRCRLCARWSWVVSWVSGGGCVQWGGGVLVGFVHLGGPVGKRGILSSKCNTELGFGVRV